MEVKRPDGFPLLDDFSIPGAGVCGAFASEAAAPELAQTSNPAHEISKDMKEDHELMVPTSDEIQPSYAGTESFPELVTDANGRSIHVRKSGDDFLLSDDEHGGMELFVSSEDFNDWMSKGTIRPVQDATGTTASKTAEWKDWRNATGVEVVTNNATNSEVFGSLEEAQQTYPELDPIRSTDKFTWAMKGNEGRMRFEDWGTERMLSSSLRKRAGGVTEKRAVMSIGGSENPGYITIRNWTLGNEDWKQWEMPSELFEKQMDEALANGYNYYEAQQNIAKEWMANHEGGPSSLEKKAVLRKRADWGRGSADWSRGTTNPNNMTGSYSTWGRILDTDSGQTFEVRVYDDGYVSLNRENGDLDGMLGAIDQLDALLANGTYIKVANAGGGLEPNDVVAPDGLPTKAEDEDGGQSMQNGEFNIASLKSAFPTLSQLSDGERFAAKLGVIVDSDIAETPTDVLLDALDTIDNRRSGAEPTQEQTGYRAKILEELKNRGVEHKASVWGGIEDAYQSFLKMQQITDNPQENFDVAAREEGLRGQQIYEFANHLREQGFEVEASRRPFVGKGAGRYTVPPPYYGERGVLFYVFDENGDPVDSAWSKEEAEKLRDQYERGEKTAKKIQAEFGDKYPELDSIALDLESVVISMINTRTQSVESKMMYKAQYVLEELIKRLQADV